MIFIDSGIFIGYFIVQDKYHSVSVSYLDKIFNEDLVTSSDIVTETINWLTRKSHTKLIQDIGNILIEEEIARIIAIDYEDRLEALEILKKYSDQKLSFTDATSFAVIKRFDIKKVFSLDKHFKLLRGVENILN